MTLEARRLRLAQVLVATTLGALALLLAPAVARGAGPERAPVKAPSRLGPEPAPVVRTTAPTTATTPTTIHTVTSSSTTTQVTPTTTSRPAIASTTSAPPQQRPATIAKPKPHARPTEPPRATHKLKATVRSVAQTIRRPASSIAFAAPAATGSSDRLLFIGGLALLVLVLGDATFLAVSARVIREQR